MRRLIPLKLLIVGLLAACVTVNVYFPAAAAEQAADRIIDTVTRQQDAPKSNNTEPSKTPPQSCLTPANEQPLWLAAAGGLLNVLVPAAQAQSSPNLDVSDPPIRAVTSSMQQRFNDLKKYFDSGVVGLTADGQVAVR